MINKHTATMVLSCLYSHDTARILKQAIELLREQRQILLNISSPRVKVRETEVVKCSLVGRYLVVSGFLANQRSGNRKPFLFVSIYLVLKCLCFTRKWYPLRQLKY